MSPTHWASQACVPSPFCGVLNSCRGLTWRRMSMVSLPSISTRYVSWLEVDAMRCWFFTQLGEYCTTFFSASATDLPAPAWRLKFATSKGFTEHGTGFQLHQNFFNAQKGVKVVTFRCFQKMGLLEPTRGGSGDVQAASLQPEGLQPLCHSTQGILHLSEEVV